MDTIINDAAKAIEASKSKRFRVVLYADNSTEYMDANNIEETLFNVRYCIDSVKSNGILYVYTIPALEIIYTTFITI